MGNICTACGTTIPHPKKPEEEEACVNCQGKELDAEPIEEQGKMDDTSAESNI